MKRIALSLVLIVACGCAHESLGIPARRFKVSVYSGGQVVKSFEASFVECSGGFAWGRDVKTGKDVCVSGTVVVEEQ